MQYSDNINLKQLLPFLLMLKEFINNHILINNKIPFLLTMTIIVNILKL